MLRIELEEERRDFALDELPVALGITRVGTLAVGQSVESMAAAWIGASEGSGLFLQAMEGAVATQHNGAVVGGSVWLRAGDEVQVGDVRLAVQVDADVVVLKGLPKRVTPTLLPPPEPPPASRGPAVPLSHPVEPPAPADEDAKEAPVENSASHEGADDSDAQALEVGGGKFPVMPDAFEAAASAEAPSIGGEPATSGTSMVDSEAPEGGVAEATSDFEFGSLPGSKKRRSFLAKALTVLFCLLVLGVIGVLTASSVELEISPQPDATRIEGLLPPIPIKERFLVLPGAYKVIAEKEGYHPILEQIDVEFGEDLPLVYELKKLPGSLDVESQPAGAEIRLQGRRVGVTPLSGLELEPGRHELTVVAERYLPSVAPIEIEGMGVRQTLEVELKPGWGTLEIETVPPAAVAWLGDARLAPTPSHAEPMAGTHLLRIEKDGFKPYEQEVVIEAGQRKRLPLIALERIEGFLSVSSEPVGARVTINGEYRGETPVRLTLASARDYDVKLSTSGYKPASQAVRLEPEEEKKVHLTMDPEMGTVFILVDPPDTTLVVDGEAMEGPVNRRISLQTVEHDLEFRREGYETKTVKVLPVSGSRQTLEFQLQSEREALAEEMKQETKTVEEQVLVRVPIPRPVRFEMGSSRREPSRRSNEGFYSVELTRTFEIGKHEVTNREFQRFIKGHSSGTVAGYDLNEPKQPATSVSWQHAAGYANWLSMKEGLPPAYVGREGSLVPAKPLTDGYRLPTEAEWAYVARLEGGGRTVPLRFPWGESRTPTRDSGNFADSSANQTAGQIIEEYQDGHAVAAPVGSFTPNSLGVCDLGGNVSEWCHDYYDVPIGAAPAPLPDPTGPTDQGQGHVVRGSSWRNGGIPELRYSHRDSEKSSNDDLGFRIARYFDGTKQD
ncbi:MAG: sulfatase activating formylglycine-generating enzyme [Planctomycetota bacterium]|jgi:formylglycine-generating enzyme required for sulfatase activity